MHSELAPTSRPLASRAELRRASRRTARALLVLSCLGLCVAAADAQGKRSKPVAGTTAIEALFEGVQPAIRECALTHAIYKGATAVDLQATLMVARDGRVFSAQVTAKLTPTADAKRLETLQSCIGDTLRKMHFPQSNETFRKLLRTWKFATG